MKTIDKPGEPRGRQTDDPLGRLIRGHFKAVMHIAQNELRAIADYENQDDLVPGEDFLGAVARPTSAQEQIADNDRGHDRQVAQQGHCQVGRRIEPSHVAQPGADNRGKHVQRHRDQQHVAQQVRQPCGGEGAGRNWQVADNLVIVGIEHHFVEFDDDRRGHDEHRRAQAEHRKEERVDTGEKQRRQRHAEQQVLTDDPKQRRNERFRAARRRPGKCLVTEVH